MTTAPPVISVILLPSSDRALRRALRALARQTLARGRFEAVVAGWSDALPADAAAVPIRVVPPAASRGAAANRALEQAGAALVMFLPDVVEIGADALARHVEAHAASRCLCLEPVEGPAGRPSLLSRFMEVLIEAPLRPGGDDAVPMRLRWQTPLSMPRDACVAAGGLSPDAALDAVLLDDLEIRARGTGIEVIRLDPGGTASGRFADLASCAAEATAIGRALPALYETHPASAGWTDLGTLLVVPVDPDRLHARTEELADLERTWLASDPAGAGEDLTFDRVLQTLTDGWWDVLTGSLAHGVQQAPAGYWPQDPALKRQWLAASGAAAQSGPTARLGNPRQLHGVRVVAADSVLEPIVVAGRRAERMLQGPSGGWHLYVQLDHRPVPDDRPLVVEVEYLDSEHVLWGLEYDSRDTDFQLGAERAGAFKRAAHSITNEDSGEWRTARFTLDDWRFERGCHGADLRLIVLDAPGSGLVVHRVSLLFDAATADEEPALKGRPADEPPHTDLTATHFPIAASPAASIVIPVHDRVGYTAACLRALAGSARVPFEVVVVDNGSRDGTAALLRQCDGVRRLDRQENDGFAVACNAGAAAARAPVVVFLNNDTLPVPGWLDALIVALEARPHVAVAGAKLLFPTAQALVQHAGMTLDGFQLVHRGLFAPPAHPSVSHSRLVPAVTGACLAIRTREFQQAGGFDPGFQNGYEDVDLCLRLRARGRVAYYCAQSVVFHHGAISAGRFAHEDRNRTRFLARWGSALPMLAGE